MIPPALPGADLVEKGLRDLEQGTESVESLLVSLSAPRLRTLGLLVPEPWADPELRLYRMLATEYGAGAHARYNALLRRVVRLQRARVCAQLADKDRIEAFLAALARVDTGDTDVFLVGGTSAVLIGWRPTTMDFDLVMRPESDALLRAIPALKERLQLNVELASPDQFIPVPPGWEARSSVVARIGRVTFRHYDFSAQALAKIERGHARDLADVEAMRDRGLITPAEVRRQFALIEPFLYRFPAIDPPSFRRAVDAMFPP